MFHLLFIFYFFFFLLSNWQTGELIIKLINKKYQSIHSLHFVLFSFTDDHLHEFSIVVLNIRYKFRYARKCSIKWICWRQTFVDDSIRGEENNKGNPRYLFEIDSRLFHTVQKITFLNAFAIHPRILFSLIFPANPRNPIEKKRNWPRVSFFFFLQGNGKRARNYSVRVNWSRTDAARNFCNLNFNETNEKLKEEGDIRKFLSFFLFITRTSI